jgi:hypothetical protein
VYDPFCSRQQESTSTTVKPARLFFLAPVTGALALAATNVFAATALDKALAQFDVTPPTREESFDFIVIGDNQNYVPTDQPECFKQMFRDFNILEPSFVIDVGDLILDGSSDSLPPQCDAFDRITGALNVPFLPVVGSHDISDEASEQLWIQHMGPTRYAVRPVSLRAPWRAKYPCSCQSSLFCLYLSARKRVDFTFGSMAYSARLEKLDKHPAKNGRGEY